ncbi:oxidoreductase [Paramyrothecium foliicola]|nr:oxidoreductase [Paramyrothecium foliicola]
MSLRALVVGGTGGIGHAIACRLAAEASSSTVIISGRNKPQHIAHDNIEFRPLDATSMGQIKQYTDAFKSSTDQKLDFLVMTQGIMTTDGRTETAEGIDRKMALHYYGKQLLIRELLPRLKEDAKVLVVFDGVYGNPAKLKWDDLDLKNHFGLGTAANHCMVMNDAMVQYWAADQDRQGINKRQFIHAWPGGVQTNLTRDLLPWFVRPLATALGNVLLTSPDKCAENLLNGTSARAEAAASEGVHWSNINSKGRPVPNKTIFTEEQFNTIATHTWGLIDGAIQRGT